MCLMYKDYNMTQLTLPWDLKDMPIVMINIVLNETLNNMNVMIVPNVL